MAKKKAKHKAPSRSCEQCGKGYHPGRNECPHCGATNPAKRNKKMSSRGVKATASNGVTLEHVKAAAELLKKCGDEQTALDAIKEAGEIRS